MATSSREQLKAWFSKGKKPLASQFASWIDSFWHKNDSIPMSAISGLLEALNQRTITIDNVMSETSENPVQNKIISAALRLLSPLVHTHTLSDISDALKKMDKEYVRVETFFDDHEDFSDHGLSWLVGKDPTSEEVVDYLDALVSAYEEEAESGCLEVPYSGEKMALVFMVDVDTEKKIKFVLYSEAVVVTIDLSGDEIEASSVRIGGGGGGTITVDAAMSETSENPVQNKVITAALNQKAGVTGTYQGLTAGGIVGQDTDATKDERQSFIFRSTAGSQSIMPGDSKITEIFGNVVNGKPFNATHFGSSTDNHFNKVNVMSKTINADGSISSSVIHKIAWLEVVQGFVGETSNNGYVIRNKEGFITPVRVGFTTVNPEEAQNVTVLSSQAIYGERRAYIPPSHGYLLIVLDDESLIDELFVTLGWSKNPEWSEFNEHTVELPTVHEWGYGKAGSVMDYVSTLEQIIKTAVDRVLMTALDWVHTVVEGDAAFTDSSLTIEAGKITTSSSLSIEVGGVSYARYADGDADGAFAWKDTEDNILYTASDSPSGNMNVYTSSDLRGMIQPSTSNVDCYGLVSSHVLTVNNEGDVIVSSATEITPETDFDGLMLYYEMETPVITPYEGQLKSYAHDFGYERLYGGNGVAPTYMTIFYLQNMTDEVRALIRRDTKRRSYTVTFKDGATMAFDVNMEGALKIVRIKAFNVATLRITTGNYIQHQISLNDGLWTGSIDVEDLALVTWEATYVNSSTPASIGVNYEN